MDLLLLPEHDKVGYVWICTSALIPDLAGVTKHSCDTDYLVEQEVQTLLYGTC
jgi:hypothetical protein